jgi:FHA domain/Bacterial regulatory protein, Fis family
MVAATKTEFGSPEWLIQDEADQFRLWGATRVYPFPAGEGIIGSADGCWLQFQDDKERVSRQHVVVSHDKGQWVASDLQSKNGIYEDGSRRATVHLAPGVELGIGGFTLIAESPMLVALRDVLARLIGWSEDRRESVDLALRSVRIAAARRDSLQLCGEGDLISVARFLHRCTLGETRPFIVCDPRRRRADPSARAATNYDNGIEALGAAAGGTLCVWQSRQPDDFDQVLEAWRKPTSRVQLIVCTHTLQSSDPLRASAIVLPPLAERASEIERIIDAYALDATTELGAPLPPAEREWIYRHEATTLASIEKATRRLIALRKADGHVTRAAALLGMTYSALSEWIARRTFEYTHEDSDS